MTSDALSDLVVVALNGLTSKPVEYEAINPSVNVTVGAEQDGFKVFVHPFSESEEAFTQGNDTCREVRTVRVLVNGPCRPPMTRALALELMEFLRNGLKGTRLGGGADELLWEGNETESIYDAEVLKTKNQFLSSFQASYYRFA